MELSSKSEYALLALLEMSEAYRKEEPMQIRQIATMHNIPDRYLEQLLAILRRQGLIRSQRGAKGGYLLAKAPWQVTLLEVLDCIEGVDAKAPLASTHSEGLERSVIRSAWQEACEAANTVLENYTLQDLCDRRRSKKQLDIMYYI